MTVGRALHTATLLTNGSVLITGGGSGTAQLASAESYNPATGKFKGTSGSMHSARAGASAILLPNGQVLVAGGFKNTSSGTAFRAKTTSTYLATAETFNPKTGKFTSVHGMATAREFPALALLQNGNVLVVAGLGKGFLPLSTMELYTTSKGWFTPAGALSKLRAFASATTLQDGSVLIAGGWAGGTVALDSAERYTP